MVIISMMVLDVVHFSGEHHFEEPYKLNSMITLFDKSSLAATQCYQGYYSSLSTSNSLIVFKYVTS